MTTETIAVVGTTGTILIALLGYAADRSRRRIKRLEARLRQALKDNRAFHEIEMRLCAALVHQRSTDSLPDSAKVTSELAIKRCFRLGLRADGMESPSDQATPQRIAQELARL